LRHFECYPTVPGTLINKALLKDFKILRKGNYKYICDSDSYWDIALKHDFIYIPKLLGSHRHHSKNLSLENGRLFTLEIEKYIKELEGLKTNLGEMFPKDMNYRNKFLIDEKLKVFSEYFSTLLRLRQEVHKLTFEEIKIRSGLNKKEGDDNSIGDIRELAKKIDKINKEENKNE